MNIFADYPVGSHENPFDLESQGKYFAFLTNREKCFSYLSYNINDFSFENDEMYKAMPMGYTSLWVLERIFIVNSENKTHIFSSDKRSRIQFFICMTEKDGTQKLVSQGQLLDRVSADTRSVLNSFNNSFDKMIENYSLFLRKAKEEINAVEIVIVGANLLESYNWH